MKRASIVKLLVCLFVFSFYLYSYLEAHNQMTRLRIDLPKLAKEVKEIQEENLRLRYQVETFESPDHLIELAKVDQFSHLKYPSQNDIWIVPTGIELTENKPQMKTPTTSAWQPTVLVGAK